VVNNEGVGLVFYQSLLVCASYLTAASRLQGLAYVNSQTKRLCCVVYWLHATGPDIQVNYTHKVPVIFNDNL